MTVAYLGNLKRRVRTKEYIQTDNMDAMIGGEWMRITKFRRGDW